MQPLPPHVQARVDELVACAPPLSESQQRAIQRALVPVVRALAVRHAAAREPQAA